jgi:hypothetical protein
MMKRISQILEEAAALPDVASRVEYLHKHDSVVLQGVLKVMFDENINLDLPEGEPPYKPNSNLADELEERLYAEWKKMYLFFPGNGIQRIRREQLFIQYLEGLHPEDAKLILAMKEHRTPWKPMSAHVARKAYPNLFPEQDKKSADKI